MDYEEICSYLKQCGHRYSTKDIEHGIQIKVATGEVVNCYRSGKIVVNGKRTPLGQTLSGMVTSGFVPSSPEGSDEAPWKSPLSNDVFIAYGHDKPARDALELMLRRMGLNPIVLENLPASGDTIIEKLERYLVESNNVGFACVLLTPDDQGHRAGELGEIKYRARQNVILELGMALSRLGRKRVAILYKTSVERPSDIDGLLYLGFQESVDEVKPQLFRELKAAGYNPHQDAL